MVYGFIILVLKSHNIVLSFFKGLWFFMCMAVKLQTESEVYITKAPLIGNLELLTPTFY